MAYDGDNKNEWKRKLLSGKSWVLGLAVFGLTILKIFQSDYNSVMIFINFLLMSPLFLFSFKSQKVDRHLDKVSEFQEGLKLWEELVMTSKITQFESFLKTVKKHQTRIEAYISSKLTTAISEGINNKIKVLKRVGYTYTNETSFKNKILQRCGFINSRHLDTSEWYWHVPTPH